MAEYFRDNTHQFCDSELCMVIDTLTGEPLRVFTCCYAIGTFADALAWLVDKGSRQRNAIVKINCVGAFPLISNAINQDKAQP